MNRKILSIAFWMIIFAAIIFPVGPLILAFCPFRSDTSLEHALWVWRFFLILFPLVTLFLGMRETLPGTKISPPVLKNNIFISRTLGGIALAILTVVGFGAWLAFRPPAARPNVSITFLGYSNEIAGDHKGLVQIAITNLDATTIFIYEPVVKSSESTTASLSWTGYQPADIARWNKTLDGGVATILTFTAPTNQNPWKIGFYVYPNQERKQLLVTRIVVTSCLSVGVLPRHYMRMPYDVESDWIARKNELNQKMLRDCYVLRQGSGIIASVANRSPVP